MKILVIEDDIEIAEYIRKGFLEHGNVVDVAHNGYDGLFMASENSYDVLVIDRMLPKMDGITLLKTLRDSNIQSPAIFLTAMGNIEDKLKGFEHGADDYLVKPFAFAELYARACSLARRPILKDIQTCLKVNDLELDLIKHSAVRAGKLIDLQPTEFRLLEYLMRHAGRVVTRTMLLEGVWEFHFDPKTNIVETHISRLRSKIDRGFDKELIQTVRGSGYIIHED